MSLFEERQLFLLTGASSGIGRAIAQALAANGARVICNGRNQAALEECCAFSENNMYPEPLDLATNLQKLPAWLGDLSSRHGPLSGLVNCAGITWNAPLSFYNLPKAEEIFAINCHAPLILSGAFCKKKINAGAGSAIVNVAAAAALEPNPGQGIYAAAKAALVAGSNCLAKEAAPAGVRVNCVSPGLVTGPMCDATIAQLGPAFLERERLLYPLGLGKAEYVADLTLFLLSAKAAWITGQNLLISGGR